MMLEYGSASSEPVEGRSTLSDLLAIFESPWVSLVLGFLFIWAAWLRSRRHAPNSIMASGGKYVFGFIGVLLLCSGAYLLWRGY